MLWSWFNGSQLWFLAENTFGTRHDCKQSLVHEDHHFDIMRMDVSAPNMQDQNNQSIPSAVLFHMQDHQRFLLSCLIWSSQQISVKLNTVNFMSIISSEKYHQKSCEKSTSLLPSMCTWHFCCHGFATKWRLAAWARDYDGSRCQGLPHSPALKCKQYMSADMAMMMYIYI